MLIIIIAFWLFLSILLYLYFGYSLVLRFLARFVKRVVNKSDIYPFISILIPVYNEEKFIERKIENTFNINYPIDKFEVIVVSDHSDDDTNIIVEKFTREKQNLKLIVLASRSGKTIVKNEGIKVAKGDFVVFTDASSMIDKDSIKELISNFHDPSVGCVSSEDVNVDEFGIDSSSGESSYINFDIKLRRLESSIKSLVGNSGCCFAVRKNFCTELPPYLIRDFSTALFVTQAGYRAVHEQNAKVYVITVPDISKEFKRKVRTVIGGITALFYFHQLLNPFKYGIYSLQLISHKLLRWLEPFILIILFGCNLLLLKINIFYFTTAVLFGTVIIISILGAISPNRWLKQNFLKLPLFLIVSHLAVLWAWVKYFSGERMAIWHPSRS